MPRVMHKCQVLPFGMKNAPAEFQRPINTFTPELNNVVTYIDDVVVFSESWFEHIKHLKELRLLQT